MTTKTLATALATALNLALWLTPLAVDRWLLPGAAWWIYGVFAVAEPLARARMKKNENKNENEKA